MAIGKDSLYRLISLERQASEVGNLRRDVEILESYLKECLDRQDVPGTCDPGCLLELKGITLIKKQTKFDYLRVANNLEKENEILKKKLICSQNFTDLRNQAQKMFDITIDKIKAIFTVDNQDEKQVEIIENLSNLFNQIYNVILDKSDINRQIRERDVEINSLLKQIQQHCAILSCIKHKQGTNEKLFQIEELEETYDTWTLEKNELQEDVNKLTQVYDDILSRTERLKAMDICEINAFVRRLQVDPERTRKYSIVNERLQEVSETTVKTSDSEVNVVIENEKEHLNRLKNTVEYLEKNHRKINAMVRRLKFDQELKMKVKQKDKQNQ